MDYALIVREPFSMDGVDYPKGSEIEDAEISRKALSEFPSHVMKTRALGDTNEAE